MELIVVIVILAILAAILVPALLGYIDRAKNAQIVLNAKSVLTASQAELAEMYAKGESVTMVTRPDTHTANILSTADVPNAQAIEIGIFTTNINDTSSHANYTITYVMYKENDKTVYYDGSSWSDTKPTNAYTSAFVIK